MADFTEKEIEQLKAIADMATKAGVSIDDFSEAIKGNIKKTSELLDVEKKLKESLVNLYKDTKKNTEETKRLKDAVALARTKYEQVATASLKADAALSKLNKTISNQRVSLRNVIGLYGDFKSNLMGVTGAVAKYSAMFGAQAITYDKVVKAALDYNQSMFNLSRTQQVAGRTSKDFSSAIGMVKKNTVLGTNDFLKMADSTSKVYIGIKPTLTEMAKMATMMQSQFVPSLDTIIEKMETLAGIQARFPSLHADIAKSADLLKKAQAGDLEAAKRLEIEKNRAVSKSQASGGSQQEVEFILQAYTLVTAEQKKQMELQAAREGADKKAKDTALAMGLASQEALISAAEATGQLYEGLEKIADILVKVNIAFIALEGIKTAVVLGKGFADATKTVVGMGGALGQAGKSAAGMGTALGQAGTSAGTLTGKIGGLTGVLGKLILAYAVFKTAYKIGTWIDEQTGLSENIGKNLADTFGTKLETEDPPEVKAAKEARKNAEKMKAPTQAVAEEVGKTQTEYNKIVQDQKVWLSIVGKISSTVKEQVAIYESFGLVNKEALQGVITTAQTIASKLGGLTKNIISEIEGSSEDLGVNIVEPNMEPTKKLQDYQMQLLNLLKEQNLEEDKRVALETMLAKISDQQKSTQSASAEILRGKIALVEAEVKQMERSSSVYESRLNTERELMEAAQFGMGASVDMMQKQVDLAYEFMQTYSKTDKEAEQLAKTLGKISDEEMERLKAAKTQGEAQDYIFNTLGKQGEEAQALGDYAVKHQSYIEKQMQQQLKIYKITKDIREGYLDAIREMSTGAGEFEKIIGTQEMGVTQLMNVVQEVSGEHKLNTMGLGGMQSKEQTAAGVGTGITGRYGAGGLSFIGGGEQNARNDRIYKYGEFEKRARQGEAGKRSTVGGTSVEGMEKYMGAEREAQVLGESTYDGTYQGVKDALSGIASRDFSKNVLGINAGVTDGNAPGKGDSAVLGNAASAVTPYLKNSQGSAGGGGHTTAPGPMSLQKRAAQVRLAVGAVKGNQANQRAAIRSKITAMGINTIREAGGWEKISPSRMGKMLKERELASGMTIGGAEKIAASGVTNKGTIRGVASVGGTTSGQATDNFKANAERLYGAKDQDKEVSGTITIKLGDGLLAKVDRAQNVAVEVLNGVT